MKANKIIAAVLAITLIGGSTTGYLKVNSSPSFEVSAADDSYETITCGIAYAMGICADVSEIKDEDLNGTETSKVTEDFLLGTVKSLAVRANHVALMIRLEAQLIKMITKAPTFFRAIMNTREAVALTEMSTEN